MPTKDEQRSARLQRSIKARETQTTTKPAEVVSPQFIKTVGGNIKDRKTTEPKGPTYDDKLKEMMANPNKEKIAKITVTNQLTQDEKNEVKRLEYGGATEREMDNLEASLAKLTKETKATVTPVKPAVAPSGIAVTTIKPSFNNNTSKTALTGKPPIPSKVLLEAKENASPNITYSGDTSSEKTIIPTTEGSIKDRINMFNKGQGTGGR